MKAVIIEDEIRSRKILQNSLSNYCKEIEIIGYAETVEKGTEVITTLSPELVFLDIDLPDGSGFEILEQLPKPWPKIIFVTAYNEYAVSAFRISAIDYLLKPVDPELLQSAVQKAIAISEPEEQQEKKIQTFKDNRTSGKLNKMVLPTLSGLQLIRTEEIIRLQSDGNYTTFFLKNKSSIIVSKPIRDYENMLESLGFFRVHQSHIINLEWVDRYIKGDGGTVIMEDGSEVEVARRRKEAFLHRLTLG
jgi:two-component system LytT family response regulator